MFLLETLRIYSHNVTIFYNLPFFQKIPTLFSLIFFRISSSTYCNFILQRFFFLNSWKLRFFPCNMMMTLGISFPNIPTFSQKIMTLLLQHLDFFLENFDFILIKRADVSLWTLRGVELNEEGGGGVSVNRQIHFLLLLLVCLVMRWRSQFKLLFHFPKLSCVIIER